MRADDRGIAGFFEDLPVLLFVLGGAMLLVSTACWSSVRLAELETEAELQTLAGRVAGCVVNLFESRASMGEVPSTAYGDEDSVTQCVQESFEGLSFVVNISSSGPFGEWHMLSRNGVLGDVAWTGYACRVFSLQNDLGIVLICEARCIVWKT